MPRRAASVTQADIARALRAIRSAGIPNMRVRISGSDIIVESDDGRADLDRREPAEKPERIILV